MKLTREVVRAAMASDPALLELADAVKAFDPAAKLEYLHAGGLKLGQRDWGKELDYVARVRQTMEAKYPRTAWGMAAP